MSKTSKGAMAMYLVAMRGRIGRVNASGNDFLWWFLIFFIRFRFLKGSIVEQSFQNFINYDLYSSYIVGQSMKITATKNL